MIAAKDLARDQAGSLQHFDMLRYGSQRDVELLGQLSDASALTNRGLKDAAAHGVGNVLLVVGSRTGRDGIHGAAFASEELTHESERRRPQVQVGDPFTEKVRSHRGAKPGAAPTLRIVTRAPVPSGSMR